MTHGDRFPYETCQWLAWHVRRKIEREADFRRRQIFWTRFAAIAAATAAIAGAIGWAFTILTKWHSHRPALPPT